MREFETQVSIAGFDALCSLSKPACMQRLRSLRGRRRIISTLNTWCRSTNSLEACAGSMEPPISPKLAWKWILEKLVELPDFGVAFISEVISNHVTDIEETHCRSLLERVALRNLEEMVVTNQIDYDAIPLLKALTGQDFGPSSSSKQPFSKELILRVQTEVVLSVLRRDVDEREKDWAFYESELGRVFGEAEEEDNRLLDRKMELGDLLESKNQTKTTVNTYFEKYSLDELRKDLLSLIDEKRESFKTVFLDQLSRDFLDANGNPFSKARSTKEEANGGRDCPEEGQNPNVNVSGDKQTVLGVSVVSGKKRLRQKLLRTQDDMGNDDLEEAEEGSAGMKKARKVSMNQGVESGKHLSLLYRGEEALSDPRNSGPEFMRSCCLTAHETDIETDAEAEVLKRLSTDFEDTLIENGDGDAYNKRESRPLSENGSDQGHPQNIVETEVARKEAITVPSERKILVYKRKEASTGSPEVKESGEQEDIEKSVTKNEFLPLDSQDIYEVDFLQVGADGHENACHICGKHGELRCCGGCPISMHFECIKALGLRLPKDEEDWYCPFCLSLKAAREAEEAEKAAIAAKEKLKAFRMVGQMRQSLPEGDALHHSGQEKMIKLRMKPPQSGEDERHLKSKQQSDEEPKLTYNGVELGSDPSKTSLFPTVLRKALSQLKQLGEQDSDHLSPEGKSQSNGVPSSAEGVDGENVSDVGRAVRVKKQVVNANPKSLAMNRGGSSRDGSAKFASHIKDVRILRKTQPSHDQEVSRRDPFAASTSGQGKKMRGQLVPFSTKKGPEDDKDDEDLDEDCDEKPQERNQGAFSGRRRLPGLRRKRLHWTRLEEQTLKEGVKRFSHNGAWGFKWKKILEFGQGIFDPSRTDVDLKDKWRNLVK